LQLHTALHFPFGRATGDAGDTLAARYSSQFAIGVAAGAKVTPEVAVAAYLAATLGAEGDDQRVESQCRDRENNLYNDIACDSSGFRLGALAQYSFLPSDTVNPWLGAGLGYESQSQQLEDRITPRREETVASGLVFPRLSAGVNWRIGRVVGLGFFLGAAFGTYLHSKTSVDGRVVHSGSISDQAIHTWLMSGLTMVLFP
jgi:hypothetical protein